MATVGVEQEARVRARRAIEALRAGVPNRDAVAALGCDCPPIEAEFNRRLDEAQDPRTAGGHTGLMVAGNFGTGKSHLLEYLDQLAQDRGFVVSKVVVSKETPLHDPVKLFRSAIGAATLPGRFGAALPQLVADLAGEPRVWRELARWARGPGELNARFEATALLFGASVDTPEVRDRIVSFWAGDPIYLGDLRARLRQIGHREALSFASIPNRALAYQRFRFAARLLREAGYAGWVLLFDEVDLIARYTINQRAKAYAEIARWCGQVREPAFPGVVSVLAITSAFVGEVLDPPPGRNDRAAIPEKLRPSVRPSDQELIGPAEKGMQLIGRAHRLPSPSAATVDATYALVRRIHAEAYDWEPPDVGHAAERLASARMREYVRRWINEWDLRRLYPGYRPTIEVGRVDLHYTEDAELEAGEE